MARKVLLFVLALLPFSLPASAQTVLPLRTHNFQVGLESYYFEYKEPGIMKNQGWLAGVNGSYAYHRAIMARAEARVAAGLVDYSSVNTGSAGNITDVAVEVRGLLGYDFRYGSWLFTPFVGFGFRYLDDDAKGTVTTTGALGYDRESEYYYSPIGIEAVVPVSALWNLGLSAEYDLFWSGTQRSHLSGAIPGLPDIKNHQDDGWGFRASANFQRKFGGHVLSFGPFFRYWKIDESDVTPFTFGGVFAGYLVEPGNKTYEIGAMVSLRF